ncbi:hypothetical protein Slin15195_G048540 [Septoria linicola]|uniref:Lytic polysaccharide monooxygenase n=1 Tax=Septoria linicola TaxID=215465 RepID=A0A9Q9AS38_9PEZI|nr:hypothetical protein Slin14017_G052100 [Septoria linicola]USW51535.1 hypothetical protein Slin15195_G048540 [Septoria linicola]
MRTFIFLTASAAVISTTRAHMFISSPKPITGTDSKSPLDPDGSQFPCQGGILPSAGGQSMNAGSEQTLAFDLGGGDNTAVHGGGSCQISITYETDPVKQKDPTNWRVIYSIEGGCPTDASGNLESGKVVDCTEGSTDTACVNEFPFSVPKGVKDGHAIMAWTWFNNIGNREMYMNCMNVEFTGGDGSEMDSFPGLFVANQQGVGECPTTERYNVKFPNPGKYVTTKTAGGAYSLAVPTGSGCSGGSGGGTTGSPPAYGAPSTSLALSPSQTAATPTLTSATSMTSKPVSATASTLSPPPTVTVPSTSDGSCSEGTVPCPVPGELICIDGDHFGLCDIDNCALPQTVATGTHCVDGQIMRKKTKRGLYWVDRHRRHGHARLH